MDVTRSVLKHSLVVLIIWVILITVSTPALLKLDDVTHYRAEILTPSGTESERASIELAKITNRTGGRSSYEIILVTGVDAVNSKLIEFDLDLSNSIEQYVTNYSSLYKIVRRIFENIDKDIYNSTLTIYSFVNQTIVILQVFSEHGSMLLNLTRSMHYYLDFTRKYYDEFNNTFARVFSEQLFRNLSMIPRIYILISGLYNGTIIELSYSKNSFEYSLRSTSYNYTFLLYDVVRIHYYLLHYTTAYQTGLNKTIINSVIEYTSLSNHPVEERIVNKTYSFIVENGLDNVNLLSLNELLITLIEEHMESLKELDYLLAKSFLETYSKAYINILYEQNVDLAYFFNILSRDIVEGQLDLLSILSEYNNTVLIRVRDEFVKQASEIIANYYKYPINSIHYIEMFLSGDIDSTIASREVTKVILHELTRSLEVSVIVDIVHKHSGSYTYSALRDVIYAMLEYIGFRALAKNAQTLLESDQLFLNISKTYRLLAEILAREVWNNTLTRDYVYRLTISLPLVFLATQFSDNTELVDDLIRGSELVNSIVNETYEPGNYTLILSTLEYIVLNTGFNLVNIGLQNITLLNRVNLDLTNFTVELMYKLIHMSLNISTRDYLRIYVELLNFVEETPTYFSNEDLVELLARVVNGENPVDAVVKYVEEKQLVEEHEFANYLRESLVKGDPLVIYSYLRKRTLADLLKDFAKKFVNIMVSEDYRAFTITIHPAGDSLDERVISAYRVVEIVEELLRRHGFEPEFVGIIGDTTLGYEMRTSTRRDMRRVQLVSIIAPVAVALVLITGVLATVVPFIGIAASLAVSSGLLYLLASRGFITVTSWSRMLLITTSFGLGMDYSSYIVLRFKEKYPEIRDKYEAAYEAVKYALPAIIAASSTDLIGFAVMKLAWEFPLIASIGETIPIAILVVMLVSITLTPSLLALFGDKKWFWWPHDIRKPVRRIWRGFEITPRRAYMLLILTVVIVSVGFIGFSRFRGSHDYSVFIPQDTDSYRTYVELQRYFPSGKIQPVYAVFILSENYSVEDTVVQRDLDNITREIESKSGVAYVYSFLKPGDREPRSYIRFDNKSFYIEIVFNIPPLSREGVDLVKEIRRYIHSLNYTWISEVYVGGAPASSCEIEDMLNYIFWVRVFPTAFVLMWICMALSFKSILIGILALVTIIAGYLFGVATSVYVAEAYNQPILWFLTLITLPAVLGVGLDYNSFYINRQRLELINYRDSYRASTISIRSVSHLVVGLGLIVTITYGSIATGSSWGLRELGIALSTSVFVTTILSALVFIPAVLALLSTKAWWPGLREQRR